MAEMPARTVVNFKESCVDPLAKLVMLEAMSFAVEKAESRLEALGKIFPGLADIGAPILQDIKDIRFSVENMNVCSISGPAVIGNAPASTEPPPPAAAINQLPKREQDLIKAMPSNLQTALLMELERKPGESVKNPDFFVKGQPIEATKGQKKSVEKAEEKEKKERTLSTSWGPLEYKDLSYTSPGAFLAALHGGDVDKIRGRGNYLKQFEAEGFDVFIGDKKIEPNLKKEEVEALKGVGLRVATKKGVIRPTPSGGKPVTKAFEQYKQPWTIIQDESGKALFIQDVNKVTIPESVWRQFSGDELERYAPLSRKEIKKPSEFVVPIPGLPVRGGKVMRSGGSV